MRAQSENKSQVPASEKMSPEYRRWLIETLRGEIETAKVNLANAIEHEAETKKVHKAALHARSEAAKLDGGKVGEHVLTAGGEVTRTWRVFENARDAVTGCRARLKTLKMRLARCEAGLEEAMEVCVEAWSSAGLYIAGPILARAGELPTVGAAQAARDKPGFSVTMTQRGPLSAARNMWTRIRG